MATTPATDAAEITPGIPAERKSIAFSSAICGTSRSGAAS
jgi:hypothetical protein